ncbi:lysosomal alpha-glucosidase [Alosa sapidissima]|uniref:lysosomal alpha-glucosidase n=1 Tax=Alosa sapidissima TaxID=34773 RepID=UPI001C07F40A|nr:lysosomal alpha-glucosidase [Alosa sapidissima]
MVSYKRLSPEEVHFSGCASLDEPLAAVAEVEEKEADVDDVDVEAEQERPLLLGVLPCSITGALLTLGGLVLAVCAVWLLGTIVWLRSPVGTQGPHRPPAPAPARQDGCSSTAAEWRFDCYPERDVVVTQAMCESRNCCFIPVATASGNPGNGVPWCFYPPDYPSYSLVALNDTETGQEGTLVRTRKSYYGNDVQTLRIELLHETDQRLRVRLTDPVEKRYEVPIEVPVVKHKAPSPSYNVELRKDPFALIITRADTGVILLNTSVSPLFYADQFLQFSASLPSRYVFGLGEHRSSFLHSVQWNTLTMWARDVPPTEYTNLYGVHPFYLCMESDGSAHGFFLLNSNAMDVVLQPAPAVTWRTIGGILDFYVFTGPDPSAVIGQYLEVIGRPAMPVYWAMGYHLCRWGYKSSNATWDVVKTMRNYGMPQDVQWNDIDYMDGTRDFTFDPVAFATLPDLVKDLHRHDQKYVMILDPGISSTQPSGSYWPFDEGIKRGVFINDSDGHTLIGKVWPGLTAFPDFTDPVTQEWWFENLQKFHALVPFDGLWIDMNEPSNFVDGSLNGCPETPFDAPPYTPGVLGGSLRSKTICASARQKLSSHYNLHSLYGLMEAKASSSALERIVGKRPFVISRSTFPSQGRYSGHWLGDNRSQWKDLYTSIAGMLTFNLLGIPLVGADICGFSGQTNEELCVRWTQLGAFYPFTRNHNDMDAQAQDPTVFSPAARTAMKEVLLLRYSLFPFLYTLFHHAHASGHTVARPLLFEFPTDRHTYEIDKQFLWGKSLLVTPVLEPGVEYVAGYFPKGLWYDYYTGDSLVSVGEEIKLQAPLDKINLHLREGSIIPTQRPNTTLWVSSGQPMHLIGALSEEGVAEGDLFWDDGETMATYENNQYTYIRFRVEKGTMTSEVLQENVEASYITVETVSIYGVKAEPERVTVNSQDAEFTYRANQVLTVTELGLNLSKNFTISWM